jgi:hypothetical protein
MGINERREGERDGDYDINTSNTYVKIEKWNLLRLFKKGGGEGEKE